MKFNHIIPLGDTCNVSFLMQNAKIKKETTLFEWFVTENFDCITDILVKIARGEEVPLIQNLNHVYMNTRAVFSGHYTADTFLPIYIRRRDRMIESIRNPAYSVLFVRMDGRPISHTTKQFDDFVNAIRLIHPNADATLLFFTPLPDKNQHPNVVSIYYDPSKHLEDPYCTGSYMNELFTGALKQVGFESDLVVDEFTDMS